MINEIKRAFPEAIFGSPCFSEALVIAEARLGVTLPSWLREMYLAFDGFRGPSNAQYLFPLVETSDGGSTLVEMTEFLRTWTSPDLRPFLFVGSSTSDTLWGVDPKEPETIIGYHHHMEDEFEFAGTNVLEVYLADADWFHKITAPN